MGTVNGTRPVGRLLLIPATVHADGARDRLVELSKVRFKPGMLLLIVK
jgi:hypothetical protein